MGRRAILGVAVGFSELPQCIAGHAEDSSYPRGMVEGLTFMPREVALVVPKTASNAVHPEVHSFRG